MTATRAEAVHLISRMLSVDPKRRATIEEIRQHAWINVGYPTLIDSHVKPRAPVVMEPQPESFSELLSYGFTSEDTRRILQTERNQHPIVSLYHLIEEARQRQKASHAAQDMCLQQSALDAMEAQSQRTNSLATIESAHSTAMEIASAAAEAAEQQSVRSPAMLVDVTEPPAVQQRQYNIPDVATSVVYPAATRTARPMTAYPSGTAVAYPPAAYIAQRPESAAPTTYSPRQPPAINAFFPPQSQEGTVPEVYKTAHGAVVHTLQHPVRGFFNIQTASTRPFPEIVAEVERVLRENVIAYRRDSTQLFVCEDKGNRFEIEVCEQHGAAGAVHDLFLRRLRGNVWTHKRICTRLVDSMQL